MTKASATIMYVSVVLRETVRIALMTVSLNTTLTSMIFRLRLVTSTGKDASKTAVVVRALMA